MSAIREPGTRHGAEGWMDHRAGMQRVLEAFSGVSTAVVTTHVNADGDAAGSAVALAAFLRRRGVRAWIALSTPYPEHLRFLLPDPRWLLEPLDDAARRRCREADLAVLVDASDLHRVGKVRSAIKNLPKVAIDHHPETPRTVEGVTLVDTRACAAGLLVQELIEEDGAPWTAQLADALYIAIMTDTGGFRFDNVDADCLRAAARLVERGAKPAELFRAVWSQYRPRRMELLRESMATLKIHPEGRIAWMTVPWEAFQRLGATLDDLEGFVDVPRDVAGVDVAILFRSTTDGRVKVSLRSQAPVDVSAVAKALGGGGHVRAAATVIRGPMDRAIDTVVRLVERRLPERSGTAASAPTAG